MEKTLTCNLETSFYSEFDTKKIQNTDLQSYVTEHKKEQLTEHCSYLENTHKNSEKNRMRSNSTIYLQSGISAGF